jgi:hypothetical protein
VGSGGCSSGGGATGLGGGVSATGGVGAGKGGAASCGGGGGGSAGDCSGGFGCSAGAGFSAGGASGWMSTITSPGGSCGFGVRETNKRAPACSATTMTTMRGRSHGGRSGGGPKSRRSRVVTVTAPARSGGRGSAIQCGEGQRRWRSGRFHSPRARPSPTRRRHRKRRGRPATARFRWIRRASP